MENPNGGRKRRGRPSKQQAEKLRQNQHDQPQNVQQNSGNKPQNVQQNSAGMPQNVQQNSGNKPQTVQQSGQQNGGQPKRRGRPPKNRQQNGHNNQNSGQQTIQNNQGGGQNNLGSNQGQQNGGQQNANRLPSREFGSTEAAEPKTNVVAYHAGGTRAYQPRRQPDEAQKSSEQQEKRRGRPPKAVADGKLKIIALGGLHEIGKNIYVYEYQNDIIVVDCGMAFPEDDMPGIDLVMPDVTYLQQNRQKIRGVFITHGHEDHIGAVAYLLRELNPPIHVTPFCRGLVESKLDEAGFLRRADLRTISAGDTVQAGVFSVEAINVNHSTPDSVAFAITTPLGVCIHTGDFKIDSTPVGGDMIDLARFGSLGKRGVLLMLSDSTNVERPGFTMSERTVGETFDNLFKGCKQRLIVTTFASNVHRVQQIIEAAVKHGRKVAISGRSMEKVMQLAVRLGYAQIPAGTLVDVNNLKSLADEKIVLVTTGSQGETLSALHRMAFGTHKQVSIGPNDKIIMSASPIPGNENSINRVVNELLKRGAEVVYERLNALHVSGHACQEELKLMLGLIRPQYFMPMHGEYKMLLAHARLAALMGVAPKNIFLSENGRILEITKSGAKLSGQVQSGAVLLDGALSDDVGTPVLRDRQLLSEDGFVTVAVCVASGRIEAGPEVITRGFAYIKEEDIISKIEHVAMHAVARSRPEIASIKGMIRSEVSDFIYKTTKRRPMVVPIVMNNE